MKPYEVNQRVNTEGSVYPFWGTIVSVFPVSPFKKERPDWRVVVQSKEGELRIFHPSDIKLNDTN
jgi:hypothetical protein